MAFRPTRVAMYGGLAALLVSLVLVALSTVRASPGGTGDNIEWLLSWLLILGFPTTLLAAALRAVGSSAIVLVGMMLASIVNWSAIAYVAAMLVGVLRRRQSER